MQGLKPPSPKQLKNEEALKKYAAFLCGLMLCAITARWLRTLCIKSPHLKTSSPGPETYLQVYESLQRRASWEWFGRPTFGLIILVGMYLVANIVFSSSILAIPELLNHWASRFGWMAAANMALCVFFGLKNTPLTPLATVSHAQLNILHRVVGYTAVFLLILHAVFYTIHFGRKGRWSLFIEKENIEGIGAGIAMLVLLIGIFRHRHYEVFYVSHIVGFVAAVILTGLHRPNWAKKLPLVMSIIFSVWVLDRLIRLKRMCCNLVNNSVTFHPLHDGGTRLVLKKPGVEGALPGSHCYLWIPRIRLYENHPFTIVSNGPSGLELVMKSHQGFTRAVGSFAARNPLATAWASVDGPYGSVPNTEDYDKLVLIAGGSGAAFTFGLMNRIMMQPEKITPQSIEFVWAVRRIEQLSWFRHHLHSLMNARCTLHVKVYVTGEQSTTGSDSSLCDASESQDSPDEMESRLLSRIDASNYDTLSEERETGGLLNEAAWDVVETPNVRFEKLDIGAVISQALGTVGRHQQVLVATCGPISLMDAVGDSVDGWQNKRGVKIDVHCEDFDG